MPTLCYRDRAGNGPADVNRSAVFEDTVGVRHSGPLHVGAYSRTEERERLRSSYNTFHDLKLVAHDKMRNISSKPSSYNLLIGTNELAEDLTGQRMPLNASRWKSETKEQFYGTQMMQRRPPSAPIRRSVSLMNDQEPVFGITTLATCPEIKDVYPHKPIVPSRYTHRDMYQTSYSLTHRKFAEDERLAAKHQDAGDDYLRDPVTSKKLQARVPIPPSRSRQCQSMDRADGSPSDAQLATLPHYTDPNHALGRTENQESFKNPYRAADFYFEEPNTTKRPVVQHLERSFIN